MPEYLIILVIILVVTFFLHKCFRVKIFNSKRHLLFYWGVSLLIATIWDQFAIYRGHWSFNQEYLLGIKIGYMPIEEFLFVIVVGFFALTFYKITEEYFSKK